MSDDINQTQGAQATPTQDTNPQATAQAQNAVHTHDNTAHHIDSADIPVKTEGAQDGKWYLSEGVEGQGEPPEWFDKTKYKTVADQAKGMPGMRKILGDFTGAPEQYKVEIPEDLKEAGIGLDLESDLYKQFSDLAKQSNLSQDGFNKIVNLYLQNYVKEIPSEEQLREQFAEELKEIGGQEKLDELEQWGMNNLPDDMYEIFREKVASASDAKLFMYIRDKLARTSSIPSAPETPRVTREDLLKMHGDPRMKTDPAFQKHVTNLYKQVYPPKS